MLVTLTLACGLTASPVYMTTPTTLIRHAIRHSPTGAFFGIVEEQEEVATSATTTSATTADASTRLSRTALLGVAALPAVALLTVPVSELLHTLFSLYSGFALASPLLCAVLCAPLCLELPL